MTQLAEKPTEKDLDKGQLIDLLRQMMLIRRFEEKAAEMYARQRIAGFLHLYIGEEAVAVGAISALNDDDHLLTHYRDHGHALARGVEPRRIMAELFGKETGVSKGRGGPHDLLLSCAAVVESGVDPGVETQVLGKPVHGRGHPREPS